MKISGCCCGHGKKKENFIAVHNDALGYKKHESYLYLARNSNIKRKVTLLAKHFLEELNFL